jgi:hypothetical protein
MAASHTTSFRIPILKAAQPKITEINLLDMPRK